VSHCLSAFPRFLHKERKSFQFCCINLLKRDGTQRRGDPFSVVAFFCTQGLRSFGGLRCWEIFCFPKCAKGDGILFSLSLCPAFFFIPLRVLFAHGGYGTRFNSQADVVSDGRKQSVSFFGCHTF
jgi:hypothetical protein